MNILRNHNKASQRKKEREKEKEIKTNIDGKTGKEKKRMKEMKEKCGDQRREGTGREWWGRGRKANKAKQNRKVI